MNEHPTLFGPGDLGSTPFERIRSRASIHTDTRTRASHMPLRTPQRRRPRIVPSSVRRKRPDRQGFGLGRPQSSCSSVWSTRPPFKRHAGGVSRRAARVEPYPRPGESPLPCGRRESAHGPGDTRTRAPGRMEVERRRAASVHLDRAQEDTAIGQTPVDQTGGDSCPLLW